MAGPDFASDPTLAASYVAVRVWCKSHPHPHSHPICSGNVASKFKPATKSRPLANQLPPAG